MKILVCGGRDYSDFNQVSRILHTLFGERGIDYTKATIIHGTAKGADSLASRWAQICHVREEKYKPDWDQFGKAAGVLRNVEMLQKGKPDLVVAFPGGVGTAHMVRIAKRAGVEVMEVV